MSGILSEILTNVKTQDDPTVPGGKKHVYSFDQLNSEADKSTMGYKQIHIERDMSVEDKRAFEIVKNATKQLKVALKAAGDTELANNIPNTIAEPPEFVVAYYAYELDKQASSNKEFKRVRGTLSALKSRNPAHVMDPSHIDNYIVSSIKRLTQNIRSLAGGTDEFKSGAHEDIAKAHVRHNTTPGIASIAHHDWVLGLRGGTSGRPLQLPTDSVIVPISSSAGSTDSNIIAKFANELSKQTANTPIIKGAFYKSNNPRVSAYTFTKEYGNELRIGDNFVADLINSGYYNFEKNGAVVLQEIQKFAKTIGIPDIADISTTRVEAAIDGMGADLQKLAADEIQTASGTEFSSNRAKLVNYYKHLVRLLRISLTKDYDGNRTEISHLLQLILDLKSVKDDPSVKEQRKDLIDKIRLRREFLKCLPTPVVDAGDTSFKELQRLLRSVRAYYTELNISNETTDAQIATIKKHIEAEAKKVPIDELKQLYRLSNSKVFKFSGARPKVGPDCGKAFSRFQLADINVSKQLHGKHVVIVDDNVSSGGTISDAVISLYINGIVPKSIVVLTPHYLPASTAKFSADENPGVTNQDTWKQQRAEIVANINAGDAAYRQELADDLEREISPTNRTAALKLASLAIDIAKDQSKLNDIEKAQNLIPDVSNFKKYTDIIASLTPATEKYKKWFDKYIKTLPVPGQMSTYTKQRIAKAEKSKIETATIETTADKIAKIERTLPKIIELAKTDPKYVSFEAEARSKLRYLKVQQAQENNGYVLTDMKSKYKQIEQLFAARKFQDANRIILDLEKEIQRKQR